MVYIVGAGPGAEDLITLRGLRLLRSADLVIYAGSLVNPEILKETKEALGRLEQVTSEAAFKAEGQAQAEYFYKEVVPVMEALRTPVDRLEMIVDKEIWPMPSYGDLIFEV